MTAENILSQQLCVYQRMTPTTSRASMRAEGIIQSPNVMLGEQPAGPQSSAVLADILGRSQALFNFRF